MFLSFGEHVSKPTDDIESTFVRGQELKIAFSPGSSTEVREVLLKLMISKERVKIHYGNPITKEYSGDFIVGRVSYSTGAVKVPIMVYKRTSSGGPSIFTGFIMKIESSRSRSKVHYEA